MPFYADLHVHSKFARATSRDLDLEHMALWAAKKGVTLLGTGDFTHPGWFKEIGDKLVPAEPGLFRLRPDLEQWCAQEFPAFARQPTRFVLEVEISTIYKKGDKTRKVHHLHYVPDLPTAKRFIARLSRIGNLNADGRPILGLDSRDLLEITLEAGEGAYLIPAHIWTPWFAVLGSKSGFDSIEECYGDLANHIFALETGLSSDPPMNWRLSCLDRFTLVSNSDAHSPGKIGREACLFDCELSYGAIRHALETGHGYGGTIEFFPEEGKYHLDGHRACGVRLEPEQTKTRGGLCPACGKELTIGVMHRVDELADRAAGSLPPAPRPFHCLVPLTEVLGEIHQVGTASRKVADAYERILGELGSELFVLELAEIDEIARHGSSLLAEAVSRVRTGRVLRQPGYDGEYGVIRVFTDDELIQGNSVSLLFDLPAGRRKLSEEREQPASRVAGPVPTTKPESRPTDGSPAAPDASLSRETTPGGLAFTIDPLAGLDPDQRAAAEMTEGPVVIIAGPGTGKTRTLAHRIAHLIDGKGIPPERILAVTFTNRAAAEMRDRLRRLIPSAAGRLLITTFHGLGCRILREHGHHLGLPDSFRVATQDERLALLKEKSGLSEHKARRLLREMAECPGETSDSGTGAAPACYRSAMRERGWLDYDDLIALPAELLAAHADVLAQYRSRFQHVLVDEFQDIDARQYHLIRLLVPDDGNLCVIGDPDQAIYSFRGAEPRFFRRFVTDYPGARTVQLRRNYRSGRAIVEGALQAIAPASLVEDRVLEALTADDAPIVLHESPTDKAEAEFVVHAIEKLIGGHDFFSLDSGRVGGGETPADYSFADFAVLYRTDAQADALVDALGRSGIPFQRHTHARFAERAEVQALIEAMRTQTGELQVKQRMEAAIGMLQRKSSGVPADGDLRLSPTRSTLPAVADALKSIAERCGHDLAQFESELTLMSEADLWEARADRVSLLTLHACKGLEFQVVFIVGCEDGLLPLRFGPDDEPNLEEERRLFFVGMTRARKRLWLSWARKRWWRGAVRELDVSPFARDIERTLLEFQRTAPRPLRAKPDAAQLDLFAS